MLETEYGEPLLEVYNNHFYVLFDLDWNMVPQLFRRAGRFFLTAQRRELKNFHQQCLLSNYHIHGHVKAVNIKFSSLPMIAQLVYITKCVETSESQPVNSIKNCASNNLRNT